MLCFTVTNNKTSGFSGFSHLVSVPLNQRVCSLAVSSFMSSSHGPLTVQHPESLDREKLSDGSMVRYSHHDFGTMYLPLQPRTSGIVNPHSQISVIDMGKHPLWLAELLAGNVYDNYTEIPSDNWNSFVQHALTVALLPTIDQYRFSNMAWNVLKSFFQFKDYQEHKRKLT